MRSTDKTLLEQMQISEVEISRRMELLDLYSDDLKLLSSHKIIIEENIDLIVDEFYQKQTEIDEISLLIGDADTLRRLRAAQRRYVMDLFAGHYDAEYVNNRLRIGMVHKRIGVEPTLYLSAVRTLKEILKKTLKASIEDKDILSASLDALDKLIYFDTTLVFDTYIDSLVGEIETAKKRTEKYAKNLEDKVAERTKQLEEQAKLDPLTNLFNQRALQDMLRRELAKAKRRRTVLSMVYFDIDDFKGINDRNGHMKGDEVLKYIGQLLKQVVREEDVPCRYGGDEFCLLLTDCTTDNAKFVCKKLITLFARKYPSVTLSFGIAETGPDEFLDGDQLIGLADENMYKAKREAGFQVKS